MGEQQGGVGWSPDVEADIGRGIAMAWDHIQQRIRRLEAVAEAARVYRGFAHLNVGGPTRMREAHEACEVLDQAIAALDEGE